MLVYVDGETEAQVDLCPKVFRVRRTLGKLLRSCFLLGWGGETNTPTPPPSKSSVRIKGGPQTQGTELTVKCCAFVRGQLAGQGLVFPKPPPTSAAFLPHFGETEMWGVEAVWAHGFWGQADCT